jgi:hypothetical protein
MSVNSEAYLQIQWIDVVYNNTDPTIGVKPSANAKCSTVCSIDETKTVGVPVLITSTPSNPNGGRRVYKTRMLPCDNRLTAIQGNRALLQVPRALQALLGAAKLVLPQSMGSVLGKIGMDARVARPEPRANSKTTTTRNVSRPGVVPGMELCSGFCLKWSENFLGYQCAYLDSVLLLSIQLVLVSHPAIIRPSMWHWLP